MGGRDETDWVAFDLRVSINVSPRLAERVRAFLFAELRYIEADDPEVLALEHDLAGLSARMLDRRGNPFADIARLDDDLSDEVADYGDEEFYWFGEAIQLRSVAS